MGVPRRVNVWTLSAGTLGTWIVCLTCVGRIVRKKRRESNYCDGNTMDVMSIRAARALHQRAVNHATARDRSRHLLLVIAVSRQINVIFLVAIDLRQPVSLIIINSSDIWPVSPSRQIFEARSDHMRRNRCAVTCFMWSRSF